MSKEELKQQSIYTLHVENATWNLNRFEGISLKDGTSAANSCQACQSHLSTRLGFVSGSIMLSQLSIILSRVLLLPSEATPPKHGNDHFGPLSNELMVIKVQ